MSCNNQKSSLDYFEDEYIPIRFPCNFCHRKFNPESLTKHSKVCEKLLHKKRKVFDSSKQRIQGTELAEFVPSLVHSKKFGEITLAIKSPSNWKENHMALINIIKAARNEPSTNSPEKPKRGRSRSLSVTKTTSLNQQKCLYCDRSFGPKSYDRHIEWCKEKSCRITQPPASVQEAKERLDARTKYRSSFRSKRSIMRDKYAPKSKKEMTDSTLKLSGRDESVERNNHLSTSMYNSSNITSEKMSTSTSSLKSNEEKMDIDIPPQKSRIVPEKRVNDSKMIEKYNRDFCHQNNYKKTDKSGTKDSNHEVNFIRQNVLRCSYKSRLPNKNMQTQGKEARSRSSSETRMPYKDHVNKQNESITATGTKIKPSQPKLKISEAKYSFPAYSKPCSSISDYDPFLSAEIQMQELMNSSAEDLCNSTFTISSPVLSPPIISSGEQLKLGGSTTKNKENLYDSIEYNQPSGFSTSPQSSFHKYSSNSNSSKKSNPSIYSSTSSISSEKDYKHFFPPVNKTDIYSTDNMSKSEICSGPTESVDNFSTRYPLVSLSNISLCSSVTADIPENNDRKKGASKSAGAYSHSKDLNITPIQRSVSLYSDECHSKSSAKNKINKERSFYDQSKKMTPVDASRRSNLTLDRSTNFHSDNYENDLQKSVHSYENMERNFFRSVSDLEKALEISNLEREIGIFSSPESGSNSSDSFKNMFPTDNKYESLYGTNNSVLNEEVIPNRDMAASKMSVDSAYNSLHRESPIFGHSRKPSQKISASHFDFDSPKSKTHQPSTITSEINQTHDQHNFSKFCHECGAKYPVSIAKFCCECGVRRLVL